jgi:alkylation response protein AidB-like acyl-CoA dehydrogenase
MTATVERRVDPAGLEYAGGGVGQGAIAQRVRDLAPWLLKRSAEHQQTGTVAQDVVDALREAGCLRLVAPACHGGAELGLPEAVAVIETLARADGTLGWLIGQVTLAHAVIGYLPEQTIAEIYAPGPDRFLAGAAAAKGRASWAHGAWRVSGRWPLVSGVAHAEWLYLQCIVVRDGKWPPPEDQVPEMRTMLVPAHEARIIPTWRGLGLRGSGSDDVHLSGASCPAEHSCDLIGEPTLRTASARVPVRTQAGLVAAAFMLGTAGAAIDAIGALAANKRPAFSTRRLAESPRFQEALGEAYVTLGAARALLYSRVRSADEQAAGGDPIAPAEEALLRATGPKVAELATSVVDTAYGLGGSTSVSDASALQRHLRDARSIGQHATLSTGYYGAVGAFAAGGEGGPR